MLRRRRILRKLLYGILAIPVILFALWVLRGPLLSGPVSRLAADRLAEATGIRIEIGRLGGSWFGSAEIEDIRVVEAPGFPALEEGSIRRIEASWSLFGLLTGREGALESVEIEGLRAVIDLDRLEEGEREATAEEDPGEAGDPSPYLPGAVTLRDVEITARTGARRIRLEGLRVDGTTEGRRRLTGRLRVERARLEGPRGAENVEGLDIAASLDGDTLALSGGWAKGPGQLTLDLRLVDVLEDARRLSGSVVLENFQPAGVLRGLLANEGASLARADLRLDLDGLASGRVDTVRFRADLEGVEITDRAVGRVHAEADGPLDALRVTVSTNGPVGAIEAEGSADVSGSLDLRARIDAPDLGTLGLELGGSRLAGGLSGEANVRLVAGDLTDFRATLRGSALTLGEVTLDVATVDASLAGDRITIEAFEARHGTDRVDLRGEVVLAEDPRLDLRGSVRIEDLGPFGALLGQDLRGRIDGALRAHGPLSDPTGKVDLTGAGLGSGDRAIREFTLTAEVGPGRIEGYGRAAVDDVTSVTFALEADRTNWTDFRGQLTRLEGRFRGDAVALEAPAAFEVRADGGIGVTGLRLSGTDLALSCEEAHRDPDGTLAARLSIGRLDLAAVARRLDIPLTGTLSGEVAVAGAADAPEVDATIRVDAPTYLLPEGALLDPRRVDIEASLRPDGITVKRLRVEVRAGSLEGDAVIRPPYDDPEIVASVRAENLALDRVARLPEGLAIAGALGLDLDVRGRVSDLAPRGRITLAGGQVHGFTGVPEIREIEIDLTLVPEAAEVAMLLARTAAGTVEFKGHLTRWHLEPKVLDLDGRIATTDVRGLLAEFGVDSPVEGSGQLTLQIEGPCARPSIRLTANAADLRWRDESIRKLTLTASTRDEEIVLETLVIESQRGRIEASGAWPARLGLRPFAISTGRLRDIRGEARCGSVDGEEGGLLLDGLQAWLPEDAGVRRVKGRVSFALRRDPGDPISRAQGRVAVRDLTVRLQGQRRGIRNLLADVEIGDGRIEIVNLTGRLGYAPFRLSGTVDLDGEGMPFDLEVTGDRLLIVNDPTARLRAGFDLRVTGTRTHPIITGDVRLRELLYTENARHLDFQSRPSLALLPLTTDPVLTRTRLNLHVTGQRNLVVANNVVRTELSADLRIRGTVAYPEVDGALQCHGGRLSIPGVSLAIDEAEVRFRPEEPLRPRIAFLGHATRQRIRIEVAANGPPDNLAIDLTSDPALSREDALTLLATGVLPADLTAGKAGEAIVLAGAAVLLDEIRGSSNVDRTDEGTWQRILREASERTEISTDTVPGRQSTIVTASVRVRDWLRVQGEWDELGEYNVDFVFRLLGR